MNDRVRQVLGELVGEHGAALAGDPARCEALLRDRCPAGRREVTLLLGAVRAGVAAEMARTAPSRAAAGRVGLLARRIEDELGVTPDAARWAVEGWARALGWPLEPLPVASPAPAPPAPAPPAPWSLPPAPPVAPAPPPAAAAPPPAPVAAAPAPGPAPAPVAPVPDRRRVPPAAWAAALALVLVLLALLWRLLRR